MSIAQHLPANEQSPHLKALMRIEDEHEHLKEDISALVAGLEIGNGDPLADLFGAHSIADEAAAISTDLAAIESDIEEDTFRAAATFDATIHTVEQRIRSLQNVMIGVLGLAILIAILIGYFTARTI